ncbi:MAG: DUF4158 domain-containing protein [Rhodobacteraceae bacterium]|nr:DUF4158 domain-containing protein [Paracoccaceae bacterium]
MSRRAVPTARQPAALFDLPADEATLLRHDTLDDADIEHIRRRRRPENRIGFALRLCAFRYPGRLPKAGEVIPEPVSRFVAAQLGLKPDDLLPYMPRGRRPDENIWTFSGKRSKKLRNWPEQNAEAAQSSEFPVRGFIEECRGRLPVRHTCTIP